MTVSMVVVNNNTGGHYLSGIDWIYYFMLTQPATLYIQIYWFLAYSVGQVIDPLV